MTESADKHIDELERELFGIQEMLAAVLKTTGTVVVTKETLQELNLNSQIKITDDLEREAFVFELVTLDESN